MIKKNYPVFVAVVLGLGLQFSALAQTCTPVDAITTSTLNLTSQSKACVNAADLIFTYSKTNGSRTLSYGKTTSYGTNGGNIAGASRTTTIQLTSLESGTKYYFKVDAVYQGSTKYTMTGSFTTNAAVGNQPVTMKIVVPNTTIILGNNSVIIPSNTDSKLNIQLFSINGSLVLKYDVTLNNRVASIPQDLFSGSGTYLCRITGATTLQNQTVTILNK